MCTTDSLPDRSASLGGPTPTSSSSVMPPCSAHTAAGIKGPEVSHEGSTSGASPLLGAHLSIVAKVGASAQEQVEHRTQLSDTCFVRASQGTVAGWCPLPYLHLFSPTHQGMLRAVSSATEGSWASGSQLEMTGSLFLKSQVTTVACRGETLSPEL